MTTKKKKKKVGSKAAHAHGAPSHHGASEHAAHHHTDYITIWKYLVGLLVVSVVGPMFGIKALTLITAFGIALVKAYLVVKNFMHLNVEKRFVAYFVGVAVIFMFLFYAGVSPDIMNHTGRNWSNVAAKQETERALEHIQATHGEHGESEGHEPSGH